MMAYENRVDRKKSKSVESIRDPLKILARWFL